jgi:hypothetical protein
MEVAWLTMCWGAQRILLLLRPPLLLLCYRCGAGLFLRQLLLSCLRCTRVSSLSLLAPMPCWAVLPWT